MRDALSGAAHHLRWIDPSFHGFTIAAERSTESAPTSLLLLPACVERCSARKPQRSVAQMPHLGAPVLMQRELLFRTTCRSICRQRVITCQDRRKVFHWRLSITFCFSIAFWSGFLRTTYVQHPMCWNKFLLPAHDFPSSSHLFLTEHICADP